MFVISIKNALRISYNKSFFAVWVGNYKHNDIIVNSLRLWVKYVGAFRNVKVHVTLYIYKVICNEYNRYCYLAWGVWRATTGGCCDQHSLPKLWAMVPGPGILMAWP